jgi:hypothetical protein
MRFKVSAFCTNGFVGDKKVWWIKEFREQTGCGLKEAKDVADWLTMHMLGRASFVIIDSELEPQFSHLERNTVVALGGANLISRYDVPTKPVKAAPKPNDVLKNTAIRLIRLGAISEAREVLKILI